MGQEKKNLNILAKIIIVNIIFTICIDIILPNVHDLNLVGCTIFGLVNIIMLLLSKLFSKNKIVLIIGIIAYFIIIFLTPIYKFEDHAHKFNEGAETIYEYTVYYNPYYIKLNTVYKVE